MLRRSLRLAGLFTVLLAMPASGLAEESSGAAEAVMKLLRSGRVPPSRLGPIVDIVGTRGSSDDLAYLFEHVVLSEEAPLDVRRQAARRLTEAARTRGVIPSGDLHAVEALIGASDFDLRQSAIVLAGLWKVEAAAEPLTAVAGDTQTANEVRVAALQSLTQIDRKAARRAIEGLSGDQQPFAVRAIAIAALAEQDVSAAASLAAAALQAAQAGDDPAPLVAAFLKLQGGTDQLALAIADKPPAADTAKLALRAMYATGRSDASLSGALEQAAGIQGNVTPPSAGELAAMMHEVVEQGNPARGEGVFRRADLSCFKCHALSQAGGQIGPDLSAIGSSSPLDYIIKSLFDPDAQIKEGFLTRTIITTDGRILQGIVADRTQDVLTLKDAEGARHAIALADIDEEIEGKSLMPKGLVKFMTQDELIDLFAFLSQLGKPGDYAIRATPRMQRWRVLLPASRDDGMLDEVPFFDRVLQATGWRAAYARVGGELPLDDSLGRDLRPVIFVQGEFDVSDRGEVGFRLAAPAGTRCWIDAEEVAFAPELQRTLEKGPHKLTLRVSTGTSADEFVRAELYPPPQTHAKFRVIDGQ